MSTGAFAARKIRERDMLLSRMQTSSQEQMKYSDNNCQELSPLKYNSKLMNSIWGLYNRYSVHNIKQHTDSKTQSAILGEQQQSKDVVAVNGKDGKKLTLDNFLPQLSINSHF